MQNIVLLLNQRSNEFMLPFSGVPGTCVFVCFCPLSYFHEVCRKVITQAVVSRSSVVAMDSVVQKLGGCVGRKVHTHPAITQSRNPSV